MARQYFRQVPNFEYVDRNYDNNNIGNYAEVKNLFKRVKIRDELFENVNFFSRYSIIGDDRPDNVANKVYGDSNLDWLVLLANNIVNVYEEWPLSNENFDAVMLEKYGSYEKLNEVAQYETVEVKNSVGKVITPAGIVLSSNLINDYRETIINPVTGEYESNPNYNNLVDYFIEFYDEGTGNDRLISNATETILNEITFLDLEQRKDNEKRFIYVFKQRYLGVVFDDIDKIMKYKKGATQFLSDTLKRGDNIRLYS